MKLNICSIYFLSFIPSINTYDHDNTGLKYKLDVSKISKLNHNKMELLQSQAQMLKCSVSQLYWVVVTIVCKQDNVRQTNESKYIRVKLHNSLYRILRIYVPGVSCYCTRGVGLLKQTLHRTRPGVDRCQMYPDKMCQTFLTGQDLELDKSARCQMYPDKMFQTL